MKSAGVERGGGGGKGRERGGKGMGNGMEEKGWGMGGKGGGEGKGREGMGGNREGREKRTEESINDYHSSLYAARAFRLHPGTRRHRKV